MSKKNYKLEKIFENASKSSGQNRELSQPVIGSKEVLKATEILKKYKNGKTNLEKRIIDNERWYKMRHWESMRCECDGPKTSSAWLFNSILNKHADAIDNYPEPNILPREESDSETAAVLTSVIPAILEQNEYDKVYSDTWWYKLRTGTGVKGIFWNKNKMNGMGDIDIQRIDLLNLFWEPGISDIQDSRNLFNVTLIDLDVLKGQYPDLTERLNVGKSVEVSEYIHDDTVDTSDKVAVVDWYYKKQIGTKQVLHFVKYVNDIVLYASENDSNLKDRGFYDHGLYPFVFDIMFPDEGTPCGFGFIDAMKDTQSTIDRLDYDIQTNCALLSKPRFFIRNDGSINEEEFANFDNTFVHFNGNPENDLIPIQINSMSNLALTLRQQKIEELKETSGNRDFNQGGTTSGVTAASAIATLQEAGNKLSRDSIKSAYRAYAKECYLIIELIRQFYNEQRVFRISGEKGETQFINFDNANMKPQQQEIVGYDLGDRVPVFDIKVVPQKANPYAKQSQNELALQFFSSGFFNPELSDQALAALDIMQFDDKDKIVEKIEQNSKLLNTIQQLTSQVQQMAAIIDSTGVGGETDLSGEFALQQSMGDVPQNEVSGVEKTAGDNSYLENVRKTAAVGATV